MGHDSFQLFYNQGEGSTYRYRYCTGTVPVGWAHITTQK